GSEEAGLQVARRPAATAQERRGEGEGALREGDGDAEGAGHAAPRRAPAEREGPAEEAAGRAPEAGPAREGLVSGRGRRLGLALAALLAAARLAGADDVAVRAEVDVTRVGVEDQVQLTITV